MSTPTTPASSPATVEAVPIATSGIPGVSARRMDVQPTQLRRPGRATLRTMFQTAITVVPILFVAVPEIIKVILDQAGDQLPDNLRVILLGVSAGIVALAGIVARIMALPSVELLLRRFRPLSGLAAAPAPEKDRAA